MKKIINSGCFKKGQKPWNKGRKGLQVSWCKGLTKEDPRIRNFCLSGLGKKRPDISEWNRVHKTGVKQSKEHRRKNSEAIKKLRKTTKPIWNKGLTKKDHPSLRRTAKKLKKIMKGRPAPWVKPLWNKKFWYYGKRRRIRMRSGWEVKYAKWLDKNKIKWLYESFIFVGKKTSYCPDFYLITEKKFIEIKGAKINLNKKKIRLVKRCGATIEVLFGKHLKKLGVLKKSTYIGKEVK